jgi:hypothetical protein
LYNPNIHYSIFGMQNVWCVKVEVVAESRNRKILSPSKLTIFCFGPLIVCTDGITPFGTLVFINEVRLMWHL